MVAKKIRALEIRRLGRLDRDRSFTSVEGKLTGASPNRWGSESDQYRFEKANSLPRH